MTSRRCSNLFTQFLFDLRLITEIRLSSVCLQPIGFRPCFARYHTGWEGGDGESYCLISQIYHFIFVTQCFRPISGSGKTCWDVTQSSDIVNHFVKRKVRLLQRMNWCRVQCFSTGQDVFVWCVLLNTPTDRRNGVLEYEIILSWQKAIEISGALPNPSQT